MLKKLMKVAGFSLSAWVVTALLISQFSAPYVNAATPFTSFCYLVTGGTVCQVEPNRWTQRGISVIEFGADPTGVADSTAAIQAAIDYAFTHNNAGGSVTAGAGTNSVFCPSGIYKISYPIFFDPPANLRGSAAAYNSGTTYALDAVVTYNGIPWVSLANSNTNHTPATGTGAAVWWTPTTASVTSFSYAATLAGTSGLSPGGSNSGASCQFALTYNNAPGLWTAAGNGVEVDNITIHGFAVSGGPGHHCGLPSTGIGIGIPGDGGGANRTKLVNVGIANLYYGIDVGGNGNQLGLAAENKFYDPFIDNACYGIKFTSLQNYINYVIGADVCATTGVFMNTSVQGLTVEGGNWSCEDSTEPATSFAMASVSASTATGSLYTLTATLTLSGDTYMVNTCASITACATNVYNAFTIRTTHFGVIPLQLASFNTSTNAATFTTLVEWDQTQGNTGLGDIITDMNAVSTIYAAEMVTVFDGAGITATNIHVENGSLNNIVPTRLINSNYSFGTSARPNTLTDIFLDYDPSGLSTMVTPPSAAYLATFYAQQVFDFITVTSVDLTINGVIGASADYLTASFLPYAKFTWHNSGLNSIPLNMRPASYQTAVGYSLSSQYLYAGTPGFGYGFFDIPPQSFALTDSDKARIYGWQQTPSWGNRPAPWASPCIAPAQYATLQSLPSITHTNPSNATITSGTYSSGTGVVTLTVSGGTRIYAGQSVTVSGATGTGSFASINGTVAASGFAGTTVTYQIGTGLTMTITGGTVAFNVPTYTSTYPLIFGGQQYHQCDWNLTATVYAGGTTYAKGNLVTSGGTTYYSLINSNTGNTPASSPTDWLPFHYGFVSNHFGWSYGQNLTTTNVPSIAWASSDTTPVVYLADSSNYVPALLFPGMAISLTGTGGSGCPMTAQTFIITGIHRYLGYIDTINGGQDLGPPFYSNWGTHNQCTGATVAQPSYSFTNLN